MIATTGYENFICIGELCSNMAQGAASLAVALRSKNKDFKQIAGSSAFSALFAGITEPALYGVTLRLKRPMLGACIGGAVGGLVGGFFQMKCFEIATLIIGFEDIVDEDDDLDFVEESNAQLLDNEISITSPVEGKVIPLTEVKDPTFSQEILGKGAAIIPEKGVVYAPFDGKVDAVFETGHALGLVSEDGVELLVHVGIDTVNLKGKHFTPKKKSGDTMKKGDILLEFDIDKIKADGYDVTTPIIISNTEQFAKVKACEDKVVTKESKLLSVQ
jgi:PTS system beta-glucosides-specific IIC component